MVNKSFNNAFQISYKPLIRTSFGVFFILCSWLECSYSINVGNPLIHDPGVNKSLIKGL